MSKNLSTKKYNVNKEANKTKALQIILTLSRVLIIVVAIGLVATFCYFAYNLLSTLFGWGRLL